MRPEPVTGAVVFRVLLSAWTAAYFVPRIPYLTEIYGRDVLRLAAPPLVWIGDPIPPLPLIASILGVLFVALAAFAWGFKGRVAHGVVVACLALLFGFDMLLVRAYGGIALLHWVLLWFVPYDRLRDGRGEVIRAPAWGTKLLMLQFASVYGLSVLAKLAPGSQWLDGRAVTWIVNSPEWGRYGLGVDGISRETGRLLGWCTIALETFIPLGLWNRWTRPAAMIGVLAFHGSLATSVRISVLFGLLMACHLVLFAPERWWSRLGLQAGRSES